MGDIGLDVGDIGLEVGDMGLEAWEYKSEVMWIQDWRHEIFAWRCEGTSLEV